MNIVKPEDAGFSRQRLARINTMMQRHVDNGNIAGGITLVARHGHVAHFETFGQADLATARPMQPDALFRIYSMTKPITSVAVLMLLEQGLIRLSDPIADYIPAFKDTRVLACAAGEELRTVATDRPITIHDLLTHTAGLSHGLEAEYADDLFRQQVGLRYYHPDVPLQEVVDAIAQVPLACQPGTRWKYSAGPDVLGRLVHVVSGLPFDAYLDKYLFEPLGMTDTDFWVPPEKRERLAAVYTRDERGKLCVAPPFPGMNDYTRPTQSPMGTGGLVATTSDYYRFAAMLLNKGELDGCRLLGRKTVEWMATNHLPGGGTLPGDESTGFGLGVGVLIDPGKSLTPGSTGTFSWGGAASTIFWIDPQESLIGILMQQYLPPPMTAVPVLEDFRNLVYQAIVD